MARMDVPTDGSGRVALVAGGSRGLGLGVARALAARGDTVHVASRSARSRAAALGAAGVEPARVHDVDLVDPRAARGLVERVLAADGRLDYVVHTVGDYREGPLAELGVDDLRALLESNVATALALAHAARAALRASRGRFVFFGTAGLAGLRAKRASAGYAAAKSALAVLVRSLALEEAPHGVTANLVSPGLVPHEDAHPSTLDPALHARIPAGRAGAIDEIARAVLWLCSDGSAYVTGADLPVAGGWML